MNELTHRETTRTALTLIAQIDGGDIPGVNEIINGAVKPDIDETDGAYKYHFYNPATRRNFFGEKITALQKTEQHYWNAIELYHNNDNQYLDELGRAIHYAQDMCTPVHTYYQDVYDATVKLRNHMDFENECDRHCETVNKSFLLKNVGYGLDVDVADYQHPGLFLNNNELKQCLKMKSLIANNRFFELQNGTITLDDAVNASIIDCITSAMGLTMRFIDGVK